jgi:drug/metabolite transporter (DMT)-like permease
MKENKLQNLNELIEGAVLPSSTKKEKSTVWKGVLCLILSAFSFSLMSLFVRLAGDLPTFQKAFFRNLIATIAGAVALAKSGSFKMQKGSLPTLLFRSIAGTVGIVGNFYAIDRMNISDASILNKLAPFFTVIFSIIILKEKASWKDWLFVGIAFIGAVFVVKPTKDIASSLPALIGVLGGLGAGMAYTFVRKLGQRGERKAYIVFFFSLFSTIVMLPMMIVQYQPMLWWQVLVLLAAGCMAAGAQFSLTAAYTYAPAKSISVYDYTQVLFTALWGLLFLSQVPDWVSIVGYLIIIGAAVAKYLVARKETKKAP